MVRPVIVLLLIVAACGRGPTPSPSRNGGRIAVLDFTNAPNLDAKRCAESDLRFPAPAVASWTSVWLQRRGREAERFVSREEAAGAHVFVSGQVYAIDGGSEAMRNAKPWIVGLLCWPCYWLPAGKSTIAVAGEVTRPDGSLIGRFDVRRSANGDSVANAVTNAAENAGKLIAKMVDTGVYSGGGVTPAPVTIAPPTAAVAPGPSRMPVDRIEQLESLRSRGLVTDEEYKRKRAQILDDL